MPDLSNIETIVIVMMENRSFDHMLGHLSHQSFGNNKNVDGLRFPLKKYENIYKGGSYPPFLISKDEMLTDDAPHERDEINTQIAYSKTTGTYSMSGFVESYFNNSINRTSKPIVMGYFHPQFTPITTFLANNFVVCDRWFSSLPTSTVPNRIMALSGDSRVDTTGGISEFFRPIDKILVDWLDDRKIRWRVYHSGLSFFALLRRFKDVLGDNFSPFSELSRDVLLEDNDSFPQVIIIEPSYYDAPRIGDQPNDNHAPLAIGFGEQFLRDIYQALTSNSEKWSKMLMILTYDEHGGFFDHVPPLKIPYYPPNNEYEHFESTGVRVPGIIISPLVSPGTVCHCNFDHTSILQFIAERFEPDGSGYSESVNRRKAAGIESISKVLDLDVPRPSIPKLPMETIYCRTELGDDIKAKGLMQKLFSEAAKEMIEKEPSGTRSKYPGIYLWMASQNNP